MKRIQAILAVVIFLSGVASAHSPVQATPQQRASPLRSDSPVVRWLAMGDSYSSGEGIPGANRGNPALQGKADCQRANGDNTGAKAWSVVARERLAQTDGRFTYEKPFFVACTGAVTDDVDTQLAEMRSTTPSALQKWDIVSFSFGGNNIKFADVLKGCIDLNLAWGFFDATPGCDIDEATLRRRIDMLVGKAPIDAAEYNSKTALPATYDTIAKNVQPGGHVLVVGYPQFVEEVSRWPAWMQVTRVSCENLQQHDVPMLRSATGYLNQQIALAVADADARWAPQGVHFDFIDIATRVYETSTNGPDRHGLCSADHWLNGLTLSILSGQIRKERSYHPNQLGHTATGNYLADWIKQNVSFGPAISPATASPAPPRAPCAPSCQVTGSVSFQHPTWGASTLLTATTRSTGCGGDVYMLDSAATVQWQTHIEQACYGLHLADPPTDSSGNLFVIYNPGRYDGVLVLRPSPSGIDDLGTAFVNGEGRFYSAQPVADQNGQYDIVQIANDCDPDCASGQHTVETFSWNGSDYAPGIQLAHVTAAATQIYQALVDHDLPTLIRFMDSRGTAGHHVTSDEYYTQLYVRIRTPSLPADLTCKAIIQDDRHETGGEYDHTMAEVGDVWYQCSGRDDGYVWINVSSDGAYGYAES